MNIIQVVDLVLPDAETGFEEYTTMELLSVATLIVISTFALDFIHSDRSIFKIVDLDEAWSFLQAAQEKPLSMKLFRARRVIDTNKIESFSRNFITVFYSWEHNQKVLDQRTEKLKDYLTEDLQVLNADMVRTDIPTNSTVESIQFWDIKPIDKNNFNVLFTVNQTIREQDKKQTVDSAYTLTVHLDNKENMVIVKNPTISSIPTKSKYKPKNSDSDGTVNAKTTEEIDSFLKTFFKLYPKANEKELSYYVNNQALKPINREYQFLELASSNYSLKNNQVVAQISVKYLDPLTKATQISEFNLVLQKFDNWIIVN